MIAEGAWPRQRREEGGELPLRAVVVERGPQRHTTFPSGEGMGDLVARVWAGLDRDESYAGQTER